MKRLLCIAVACFMAIVFISTSDSSAIDLEKIQTTHWETKVVIKRYSEATGQYLSSAVGQGITDVSNTVVYVRIALSVDFMTAMCGEFYAYLYNFTFNDSKPQSIDCQISYADRSRAIVYNYVGPCTAHIKFAKNTFKGTITFTDTAIKSVITLKGEFLGDYVE